MWIDHGNNRPATVYARFLAFARNQKYDQGCRKCLIRERPPARIDESLFMFAVDELKAEQKLIIDKLVGKRDVFGQLPTGNRKS